jgi:hypothetical protein
MTPNIEQGSMRAASIEDRAKSIGVSIVSIYQLIRIGDLRAIKVGRRTVVTDAAWVSFLESRPSVTDPINAPTRERLAAANRQRRCVGATPKQVLPKRPRGRPRKVQPALSHDDASHV